MLVKCSSDRGTGRRDASRKLPTSTDQAARLCYRAGDRLSIDSALPPGALRAPAEPGLAIAAVVDGASRAGCVCRNQPQTVYRPVEVVQHHRI